MTETTDAERAARWKTLLAGGAMLIISAVSRFVDEVSPHALFAVAGCVILAIGIGRGGSVVGRHPLGRVALIAAGSAPLVLELLMVGLGVVAFTLSYGLGAVHPQATLVLIAALAAVPLLAALAAAVIATVQIVRSRVIRQPLSWMALPALLLGIVIGAVRGYDGIVTGLIWTEPSHEAIDQAIALVQTLGVLLMGILIILAGIAELVRAPTPPLRAEAPSQQR